MLLDFFEGEKESIFGDSMLCVESSLVLSSVSFGEVSVLDKEKFVKCLYIVFIRCVREF